jgi:GH25 family lysozyme M1 (1,4-beta-N-acetylmuramidase)
LLLLPDLSEFQPGADLEAVKDMNGGAVILRACYGAAHPDAAFARYRASAASLGFSFTGIYQYLAAGQDAAEQAAAFCKLAGKLAPHEVPILDLEEGSGSQAVRAAVWLTRVDAALGLAPGPVQQRSWVYSGLDFAQTHGLVPVFDGPRHTWVAAYGPAEPKLGHTLWQCTDGTSGIHVTDWPGAGRCDTNVFNGTLAQLCARAGLPRH